MPWQEVCPMDEKVRLVAALMAAQHSMTELCESFRISRKTAYKWWLRYQAHGPQGLLELSRAPHRVPWAISELQAESILAMRPAHPSWGPKKLRAKFLQRDPGQTWPVASTIGELLRRHGLLIHPSGAATRYPIRVHSRHPRRQMIFGASTSKAGSAPAMRLVVIH